LGEDGEHSPSERILRLRDAMDELDALEAELRAFDLTLR
jgi:hypothetical protein